MLLKNPNKDMNTLKCFVLYCDKLNKGYCAFKELSTHEVLDQVFIITNKSNKVFDYCNICWFKSTETIRKGL